MTRPSLPLFSQLSQEFDNLFNNEFSLLNRRNDMLENIWQPDIDIEKSDKEYILSVDLPGVNPKDIKVSIEGGNLIVEGKKETKAVEKGENFRRVERIAGQFYRTVNLQSVTDSKDVKANLKNGVLEIVVPIAESARQKKIEIQVS